MMVMVSRCVGYLNSSSFPELMRVIIILTTSQLSAVSLLSVSIQEKTGYLGIVNQHHCPISSDLLFVFASLF